MHELVHIEHKISRMLLKQMMNNELKNHNHDGLKKGENDGADMKHLMHLERLEH